VSILLLFCHFNAPVNQVNLVAHKKYNPHDAMCNDMTQFEACTSGAISFANDSLNSLSNGFQFNFLIHLAIKKA